MSTPNIPFISLSLIASVLVFIPFPWHCKARNIGTCLFMAWIGLACLVFGINSIVWNQTTADLASYWCDISTKFMVGATAAISTVSLCINLRLFIIATDRVRTLEKKSYFALELILGLGFPLIEMALHYVVQGHRFDIYEGVGCRPVIDNVLLAYLLFQAPQFLFGLISVIFCILTVIAYCRFMHPYQSSQLYPSHNTVSFLWFLTLGGLTALCSIGYNVFVVYLRATSTIGTFTLWASWGQMHSDFDHINMYNEAIWRSDIMLELMLEIDRWIFVGLGLVFFAFFGFTSEARRRYKMVLLVCFKRKSLDDIEKDNTGLITKSSSWGVAPMTISASSSTPDLEASISKPLSASSSTLDLKASISKPFSSSLVDLAPKDPYPMDNPYPMHTRSIKRSGITGPLPLPLNLPPSEASSSSLAPSSSSSSDPLPSFPRLNSASSMSVYSQNTARDSRLYASPHPSPLTPLPLPPALMTGPELNRHSQVFQSQAFLNRVNRALVHEPSNSSSSLQVPTITVQRSRSNSTGSATRHGGRPLRALSRSSSANSMLGPPPPEPLQPLPPEPPLQPPQLPFIERKPRPLGHARDVSMANSMSSNNSNQSFLNLRSSNDSETSLRVVPMIRQVEPPNVAIVVGAAF